MGDGTNDVIAYARRSPGGAAGSRFMGLRPEGLGRNCGQVSENGNGQSLASTLPGFMVPRQMAA